jgi:FAD synthase
MENERLISLQNLCEHYNIEVSFIRSLDEYGLIQIIRTDNRECLEEGSLGEIERLMRMHYDLEINLAGIDAISHLLNKMADLQKELASLRNRLAGD